jgi:hypothetical protein
MDILLAIMWTALTMTNTARFVLEVSKERDITWAAYGYAALAALAIVYTIRQVRVGLTGK